MLMKSLHFTFLTDTVIVIQLCTSWYISQKEADTIWLVAVHMYEHLLGNTRQFQVKLLKTQAFAKVDTAGHAARHCLRGVILVCADPQLLTPVAVLLPARYVLGSVRNWFHSTHTSLGDSLPGVMLADCIALAQGMQNFKTKVDVPGTLPGAWCWLVGGFPDEERVDHRSLKKPPA